MARPSALTDEARAAVKAEIWKGTPNSEISSTFGVSAGALSHIKSGKIWAEVPWPDGSTGAMSQEIKQALNTAALSRRAIKAVPFYDPDASLKATFAAKGKYHIYEHMLACAKREGFDSVAALDKAAKEKKWAEEDAANYTPPQHYYNENYDPSIDPTLSPNKGMIDADVCPKVPWAEILAQYNDMKIVSDAETNQDERTKDAISITFRGSDDPTWRRGEQAATLINKIRGRLTSARYNPTQLDGQVDKALPATG